MYEYERKYGMGIRRLLISCWVAPWRTVGPTAILHGFHEAVEHMQKYLRSELIGNMNKL